MSQRGTYVRRCPNVVPMQVGARLLLFAPLPQYRSGVPAFAPYQGFLLLQQTPEKRNGFYYLTTFIPFFTYCIEKITIYPSFFIVCSTVAVSRTDKGCYRDNHQANNRPLPDMIFTDRDSGSDKYSKVPLDWKNWASYLKGLVCRCAEAVNKMKRTIFGLQFYGKFYLYIEAWGKIVNLQKLKIWHSRICLYKTKVYKNIKI